MYNRKKNSKKFRLLLIFVTIIVRESVAVTLVQASTPIKQPSNTLQLLSDVDFESQDYLLPVINPSSVLIYNVSKHPEFSQDQFLQSVVNNVVQLAINKNLSQNNISITLIDVNSYKIGEYQQNILRYPASVVKLFWMVILYSQLQNNIISDETMINDDISKMIQQSDNTAASRILDMITNTQSGNQLNGQEYEQWLNKRYQVNVFFQEAGYQDIDISQKTFPVSSNFTNPRGRDLQIKGNIGQSIRNQISSYQAARLMYEIASQKSISLEYSQKMLSWLSRNLNSKTWLSVKYFNPIKSFFGEYLPKDLYFYSKAGWTTSTRSEVAFITTKDRKVAYILAIFTEDQDYAENKTFFPEISKFVYHEMSKLNKQ